MANSTEYNLPHLLFLGDVCLAGKYKVFLRDRPEGFLLEPARAVLNRCDWAAANLEGPFAGAGRLTRNKIGLSAPPEFLDCLRGIGGLCLSNNHVMDLGREGVQHTQSLLESKGIVHWGFGENLKAARQPTYVQVGKAKIGLLAYSCLTTNGENYASADLPGVVPLALKHGEEDIELAKKTGDFVIVSIHWGVENSHYPTPDQISIAHRLVDAGADFVWGNHAHVIQPVEIYRDRIVSYGLGNFVFSDFEYGVLEGETLQKRQVMQQALNRESIGLELAVDSEAGLLRLSKIHAFKLDQMFRPTPVDIDHLTVAFDDICSRLAQFTNRNSDLLKRIQDLRLRLEFSGRVYQTRYALSPIDEWGLHRRSLLRHLRRAYREIRYGF